MSPLKRRAVILTELAKLSRDGWRHALPCDYQPLERELRAIDAKLQRRDDGQRVPHRGDAL